MAVTTSLHQRRISHAPLVVACLAEVGTGLAVLAIPALVVRLLFAQEIDGAGLIVGRLAGIALVALGIACWPGGKGQQPLIGMLAYNFLGTLYLGTLALVGMAGVLLWPAVVLHAVLTVLLARAWMMHGKGLVIEG